MHELPAEFFRQQPAFCGLGDVVRVAAEVTVDQLDGFADGREITVTHGFRQVRVHNLGAAIERRRDDVAAFLECQRDERLHHRHRFDLSRLGLIVAMAGLADVNELHMLAAERAFEQLQSRVVRAGIVVDADFDVGEIARHLQRIVERDDGLCRDRGAERGNLRRICPALDAVDAAPFADIIGVGLALHEQRFLQALEHVLLVRIGVALGVMRAVVERDAMLLKKFFLDADQNRQVEHRRVGGDANFVAVLSPHDN